GWGFAPGGVATSRSRGAWFAIAAREMGVPPEMPTPLMVPTVDPMRPCVVQKTALAWVLMMSDTGRAWPPASAVGPVEGGGVVDGLTGGRRVGRLVFFGGRWLVRGEAPTLTIWPAPIWVHTACGRLMVPSLASVQPSAAPSSRVTKQPVGPQMPCPSV